MNQIDIIESNIQSLIKKFDDAKLEVLSGTWLESVHNIKTGQSIPNEYQNTNLHLNCGWLPCYPVYRDGSFKIVGREAFVFQKIDFTTNNIIQLIYRYEANNGVKSLDYCFDPKDSGISAHPVILGLEDKFFTSDASKNIIIDELSICTSLADGVKIHDKTLAPVLVYGDINSIFNAVIPSVYKINLWLKESPKGASRLLLIEIYKRYASLCNTLEIGFYENDVNNIIWSWSPEDIEQFEAEMKISS